MSVRECVVSGWYEYMAIESEMEAAPRLDLHFFR